MGTEPSFLLCALRSAATAVGINQCVGVLKLEKRLLRKKQCGVFQAPVRGRGATLQAWGQTALPKVGDAQQKGVVGRKRKGKCWTSFRQHKLSSQSLLCVVAAPVQSSPDRPRQTDIHRGWGLARGCHMRADTVVSLHAMQFPEPLLQRGQRRFSRWCSVSGKVLLLGLV